MIVRRAVLALMGLSCLAIPAHATAAVPTLSKGSAVAYAYDGMGGQYADYKITGTLSFGTETRSGSWWIKTDWKLRDASTDAQIGTCVVEDNVWLGMAEPAVASITCLGHFDGQKRKLPVSLALVMPHVKPPDYDQGTGWEYHGRYAG